MNVWGKNFFLSPGWLLLTFLLSLLFSFTHCKLDKAVKEENKPLLIYQWISKNISKPLVQVDDTQLIFNEKYISKKSLKNNLILLNVLQDHVLCIFATQLEDIMFLNIAKQTLHRLNSQQKIMMTVQTDSDNTRTNKPCHLLQNHVTGSSTALPKCFFLSIAQGFYTARCFLSFL